MSSYQASEDVINKLRISYSKHVLYGRLYIGRLIDIWNKSLLFLRPGLHRTDNNEGAQPDWGMHPFKPIGDQSRIYSGFVTVPHDQSQICSGLIT